jgi:hypothetical protein
MRERNAQRKSGRGWKQWTESEARAALVEWKQSGLSAEAFARSRGFSSMRLAYWAKRLPARPEQRRDAAELLTSASRASISVTVCLVFLRRYRRDVRLVIHGLVSASSHSWMSTFIISPEMRPSTLTRSPRLRSASCVEYRSSKKHCA